MSHQRERSRRTISNESSMNIRQNDKTVAVNSGGGILSMIKNNSGMIILTLSLIIILIVIMFFMYKRGSDDKLKETEKKNEELEVNNKQMMQYINAMEMQYGRGVPQTESYMEEPERPKKKVIDDYPEPEYEEEEEEIDDEPTLIDIDKINNALKSPENVED